MAYFTRAHADNVVHTELFFDPQIHTARHVPMDAEITAAPCIVSRCPCGRAPEP
jgi:adenosine deaminase